MKLKIRKFNNRSLSNLLRIATNFYIQRLLPFNNSRLLKIEVVAVDRLEADGTFEKIGTNNYLVELKQDLSVSHMLVTLAHELVHLKQYVTKELKSYYVGGTPVDVWRGKRYRNLSYESQPWEIEALTKEQDLYQDFISECYISGNLIKKLQKLHDLTC